MQQPAADEGAWRLEIADGPNAGAVVSLAPGRYRLGSDTGDDIVLADQEVAASHAVLELTADKAGITPMAGDIVLQRNALKAGQPKILKRGAVVTIGGTRIRVTASEATPRPQGRRLITTGLVLAGLVGAALVYHGAAPARVDPATEAHAAERGMAAPTTLAQAVADFRDHLASTGLAGKVDLSALGGVVLARGDLRAGELDSWLDAHKWFDSHLGNRFALKDTVRAADSVQPPQLAIAAVSMEPVPNVVTQDGQRLVEGAVLADGWKIDRITLSDVILRRGGHEVRIAL